MNTHRLPRISRTLFVAGVVSLAAIVGAGTAGADAGQDVTFIETVNSQGITFDPPSAGPVLADHICTEFDSGATFDTVVDEGLSNWPLTDYQVGEVIGDSVGIYCPQHLDDIPD